jgi:hypothetical protein
MNYSVTVFGNIIPSFFVVQAETIFVSSNDPASLREIVIRSDPTWLSQLKHNAQYGSFLENV